MSLTHHFTNLHLALQRLECAVTKYAFVTLVMKGDFYVPCAIVVAQSMHNVGTKHTIVCMVTPDVSESARRALKCVFDEIFEVDYLNYPFVDLNTVNERRMYDSWMNSAMTLFRCLWLWKFDKILLLDSDVCIIRNIDCLFNLQPPAACFYNPWLSFTRKDPYPSMRHWDFVPSESINRAFRMNGSFVCMGGCMLLNEA